MIALEKPEEPVTFIIGALQKLQSERRRVQDPKLVTLDFLVDTAIESDPVPVSRVTYFKGEQEAD